MIKAYWWKGGPGAGNFGDDLTRLLLQHLSGQSVEHAPPEKADIVAVGSILEPWFWKNERAREYAGYIWGSARMTGRAPMAFPKAKVSALRGKFTFDRLSCANKDPSCLATRVSCVTGS